MPGLISNPTQCDRVLEILRIARNFGDGWVDGQEVFLREEHISQYHARIFELEEKGYVIESSWVYEGGKKMRWKRYRLISEPINEVKAEIKVETPEPLPIAHSSCREQRSLFEDIGWEPQLALLSQEH